MGVLGNIWVKLGLKKDKFKSGMNDAKKDVDSFGDKVKMFAKVGAAAFAAVASAAVAVGKDLISTTQLVGDKWNAFTTGARNAYQKFIADLADGKGWRELINNMREAYRVGKEVAQGLDELFEKQNSYSLAQARTRVEIERLRNAERDPSKSAEERAAAAKRVMELEKQLSEQSIALAREQADLYGRLVLQKTGMSEAEWEAYGVRYLENQDLIHAAQQYNKDLEEVTAKIAATESRLLTGGAGTDYTGLNKSLEALKARKAELEAVSDPLLLSFAEMDRKYQLSQDENVANFFNAMVAIADAEADYYRRTRRDNNTLGSMSKSIFEEVAQTANVDPILEQIRALGEEAAAVADVDNAYKELASSMLKQYETAYPALQKENEEIVSLANNVAEAAEQANKAAEEMQQKWQAASDTIASGLRSGLISALDELTSAIAGVEGADLGGVFRALLDPLANAAITAGTIILATGEGIEALKKSLITFFGGSAVAAGAALIAVGTAAKIGLAAIGNNAGSPASVTPNYGYNGGYVPSANTFGGQVPEIKLTGEVRIEGQDLSIALSNYERNRMR